MNSESLSVRGIARPTGVANVKLAAIIMVVAAFVCFPFIIENPYYLHLAVTILIFSILVLGLDIVFGYTGEVSLGHSALFGIGAYTAGILFWQFGIGMYVALPIGIVVAALFGALLALPALRVTGPYLAMVTLAFGTIVQILINEMTPLTNGPIGIKLNMPMIFDLRAYGDWLPIFNISTKRMREISFYFAVAAAFAITLLFIQRIVSSRYGRAFEALRDSPIASDCMAVSVYKHKVLAFVVSAGFAGLAGVLFAYSEQYIAPNNFNSEQSVQFLLAVAMGGRKSRLGPIIGATIVVLLPNLLADVELFRLITGIAASIAVAAAIFLSRKPDHARSAVVPIALCILFFIFSLFIQNIVDFKRAIYGLMILYVIFYMPNGIIGSLKLLFDGWRIGQSKNEGAEEIHTDKASAWSVTPPTIGPDGNLLKVEAAVMKFGGLKALNSVDIEVKPNTIHGLIGPNGSGKSTMMNLLTGIYVPTAGEITFEGKSLVGLSSARIAKRGVARTFQNVQLFGELTCLENVMVGLNHTCRRGLFPIMFGLGSARREEKSARDRAMSILRFIRLENLAHEEARNLPYGKMRLLEIGRALALDPKLLLLDEPAAGLTAPDIEVLIQLITKIKAHGIAVILIEHHMDVVMSISDTVTVLDFGEKIAEGKPDDVQANSRVIEAYLGGAAASAAQ